MHQCCGVSGLKNEGNHSFPKDKNVRKLWEEAACGTNFITKKERKNFFLSLKKKHSSICSAHFKSKDLNEVGKCSSIILLLTVYSFFFLSYLLHF